MLSPITLKIRVEEVGKAMTGGLFLARGNNIVIPTLNYDIKYRLGRGDEEEE